MDDITYSIPNISLQEVQINNEEYNCYKDIVRFLQSHPLHYALTAIPTYMYPKMLEDFWSNCDYHPSKNHISGSVCEGKYYIRITVKGLRNTLRLPHYKEFDPQISDAAAKKTLHKIWYVRDGIQIDRLPAVWEYLSGIVMLSFRGESGKYDQASPVERQILHSLVTGTNIDYAELIFNSLKKKVLKEPWDSNVPYLRFLSLVFQKAMGNKYTKACVKTLSIRVIRQRIYCKVDKVGNSQLTTAMRRMIKNPFKHRKLNSEADSSDSEAESLDSETGSSDSETDSSYSEPGSSSHCKSKVIPPKPKLPPPPPSETSSSQLSKSPSRNKSTEIKTSDEGQVPPSKVTATAATLEVIADMDIDNHEPEQDAYFTPSPSHNHHSSPNATQHDPPTDTCTILQAIMALTSKVDTISSNQQDHQTNTDAILQSITALTCKVDVMSSNLENIKSYMATLPTNTTTQQDRHEQEMTTLKAQNQSHHTSVQGLTSQVSALESEMKAVHHTLHTLQDNTVTSDAKLIEDIDAIKTQHFCFSVQLENFKNLQEKVHTTAINTQTAANNLNEQVNKLVKASTYQQPAVPFSSDKDDSKTSRFKRKRG